MKPLFRLYMADYSPEGVQHTSPELSRARDGRIVSLWDPAPVRIDYHEHQGYEIDLVMHGSGCMLVGEGQEFPLDAGQILIIPGGNTHCLETNEHICLFGIELYPTLLREVTPPPELAHLMPRMSGEGAPAPARRISDPTTFFTFQNLFEECMAEYAGTAPGHETIMYAFGQVVVLFMLRALQSESSVLTDNPTNRRVLAVKTWMDRHLFEPITLHHLAEKADLSLSRFSAVFRQVVGASPKAYLLEHRLQHAANLLAETGLPISEIAHNVGFNDLANFNHAFRDFAQLSPSSYRKKHQKSN